MFRWTTPRSLGLLGALAVCGCSEHKAAPAPPPLEEDTTTVLFANPVGESGGRLCPDAVRAQLDVTIPIKVWAPQSMRRSRLERHTRALESSLVHLGIHFRAVGGVRASVEEVAFTAAGPTGTRALKSAQKTHDLGPVERAAILAPFVSAPLGRMLDEMTPESRGEVQVIFVDRIASLSSPVSIALNRAAGLTLSPFAAATEDTDRIAELIGRPLGELSAPVILLSLHDLARLPEGVRLTTLAHEIGHAFGLVHAGGRENLMSTLRHARCVPGVTQEQIDVLRANLAVAAKAP